MSSPLGWRVLLFFSSNRACCSLDLGSMASELFPFCLSPRSITRLCSVFMSLLKSWEFLDHSCPVNWHPKPCNAELGVLDSQAETDRRACHLLVDGIFSQVCPFAESAAFQGSSFIQRSQDLPWPSVCSQGCLLSPHVLKHKPLLLTPCSPQKQGELISCRL